MRNESHLNYEEWKATPEGQKCMDVAPMSSRLAFAAGAASRDAEIAELVAALQEFERYAEPMITASYGREVIRRVRAAIAKVRKP